MGRAEVMHRVDASLDYRDPLLQDHRSRSSSSEGGSSSAGGGGGGSHPKPHAASNALLGTTPTLLEESPSVLSDQNAPDTPQQSTMEHQRRLSSSLPASTSVVETLFGPGLGPCWGDFSCTYNRIRGRLYATSQAVLFYTNLLY